MGYHDNLWCHQCPQSWHHDNSQFAVSDWPFIMSGMVSQITGVMSVYWTVCSGADQRKYQSSMSLAFAREIHQWPLNSPHQGSVTRKMFPFDEVIMYMTNNPDDENDQNRPSTSCNGPHPSVAMVGSIILVPSHPCPVTATHQLFRIPYCTLLKPVLFGQPINRLNLNLKMGYQYMNSSGTWSSNELQCLDFNSLRQSDAYVHQ